MSSKTLRSFTAVATEGGVCLRAYRTSHLGDLASEQVRLCIYRHHAKSFQFNNDSDEYFDGLQWQNAELIYEGAPACVHGAKFSWTDTSAELGHVYAYWLAAESGEPIGPRSVKLRDPEVWWSMQRVSQEMADLQRDHPDCVVVERIGHSSRGRDILALKVGNAATTLGMVGAIHAGEAGAELIMPVIRRVIEHHPELLEKVAIAAIPVVNVDQRQRMVDGTPWYLRTNANGVDLNRNFPADWDDISLAYGLDSSDPDAVTYRGPFAASEPETQAVMRFFETQSLNAVFSLHFLASITGARMLPAAASENDAAYGTLCRRFALPYAQNMLPASNLKATDAISFGTTGGSFPTWLYQRGVPAFDLEILADHEANALETGLADATTIQLLDEYRRRHFSGFVAAMNAAADAPNAPTSA